jgi:hypothetical protein
MLEHSPGQGMTTAENPPGMITGEQVRPAIGQQHPPRRALSHGGHRPRAAHTTG